jgi:hypothetical protein
MPKENPDWIDDRKRNHVLTRVLHHHRNSPFFHGAIVDGCCEIDTEWFSLRNMPEYLSWIPWDVCWDMYVFNKPKIEPMQTVSFRSPARKRCLAGQYAFHAQLKIEPLNTPRFDQINGKPRFGRGNSSATIGSFMAKFRHLGSK